MCRSRCCVVPLASTSQLRDCLRHFYSQRAFRLVDFPLYKALPPAPLFRDLFLSSAVVGGNFLIGGISPSFAGLSNIVHVFFPRYQAGFCQWCPLRCLQGSVHPLFFLSRRCAIGGKVRRKDRGFPLLSVCRVPDEFCRSKASQSTSTLRILVRYEVELRTESSPSASSSVHLL